MQHKEQASQAASLKSRVPLELVPHGDEKVSPCQCPIVHTTEPQANSEPIGTVIAAKAA
ncbi:MAG TPA: hypothetical protein VEO92_05060 [Candidatus Nitrosocosmicus sp.]|nr:hypothetical protein [Candidatus Nitrosocosmicus sp.]